MGMCLYAIKARFPNDQLKKVFPQIVEFWKQGDAAFNWYQENRSRCGENPKLISFRAKKEAYWAEFGAHFPLVAEMLKGVKDDGHVNGKLYKQVPVLTIDPDNALSGHIEFGADKDPWERLSCEGNILYFQDEMWHFGDLTPLAKYLQKKFGALKVRWISEEDAPELFEAIPV